MHHWRVVTCQDYVHQQLFMDNIAVSFFDIENAVHYLLAKANFYLVFQYKFATIHKIIFFFSC